MEEKIIRNIDDLNKALEEEYTNFYTKGLLNHSYHITFGEKENTYEVNDLADDLIIIMNKNEMIDWFEDNFNNGNLMAEE